MSADACERAEPFKASIRANLVPKHVRGYYPTQCCIRYLAQANEYTISMEGFVLRDASARPSPDLSVDITRD